ncbi:Gfo/Idh/MocA family protein [Anaerocolumna xylanovorans]|uniref:Oxidoreductase family, C-terminal alpha/beta domain n=1 Tax=Anaerocolumna xylanovorans DSM 12503 TaxID=1121345 RepID=A0A1M7Y6Y1_9FIRM|nr:Gfo/Idh/MocA family oxidoreductase [Anaerocolumna xylanovorans]SHO48392.1 Oxidoreductase family, C-terminal alpha/beta domain [Anaerocolumna xylanovorans DSM 12503]
MNIALVGAGQRGMIYSEYVYNTKKADIVAVVEPEDNRRAAAAEKFGIPSGMQFKKIEDFYQKGRIADAVIIASMDQDHYEQVMSALELGYDILLEKPISPNPKECLKIQDKANQKGCKVIVCHVLRYTNFFAAIKEVIDSGELGKVITIQHNENVGNYHIAHSFVRGNWRRSDLSSSLIMQKSCHDMDILAWMVGSEAKKITSFGSLKYFKEENAPEGSSDRCLTCKAAKNCRFDARKVYLPVIGSWPAVVLTQDQTEEGINKALAEGPYGRCVYRCDNDVCDNQVALIEFKNNATVSFNLSGFTNKISRTIKVMCENGEIRGDDSLNQIEVTKFASNAIDAFEQRIIHTGLTQGGHGGGDVALMEDFIYQLSADSNNSRSSITQSVESHIMAYAAEQSRITGEIIDVDVLKSQLRNS